MKGIIIALFVLVVAWAVMGWIGKRISRKE